MNPRILASVVVGGLAGALGAAMPAHAAAPAMLPAAEAWRFSSAPASAPAAEAWRMVQPADASAAEVTNGQDSAARSAPRRSVTAQLYSSSGKRIGTVRLRESRERVLVTVNARWVTTGFHGLHIHAIGKCEKNSADPADATNTGAFLSAGGHWNPTNVSHPDHAGDLGNVYADKRNVVSQTLVTDRFTVRELFDADGSALILHAAPDNFANIPERKGGPDAETLAAGDSGGRAACALLARQER